MIMEKIFIVEETTGQYEDRITTCVKAFRSEKEAKTYCDEHNKYYEELSDMYTDLTDPSSTFNADNIKEKAFHAYLKDVAPELVEQYERLSVGKLDFDWNSYEDYETNFDCDQEIKEKYYKKIELTDDEIKKMKIIEEYEDLYDGIPYFSVSCGIDLM